MVPGRPAAARALPRRHRRRRSDHRQRGQVREGGAAEGPVRLPQLPDRRRRSASKAVQYFERDLQGGRGSRPSASCSCTATTCSARIRRDRSRPPTRRPSPRGTSSRSSRGRSRPADLSTEVSSVKAAKPDIIAPITRPASAQLLLPEIRKQRVEIMGIVSPGSPGLYEAGQIAVLKDQIEYVHGQRALGELQEPQDRGGRRRVPEADSMRDQGKTFDTNSGFSYDGMLLIADVLERRRRPRLTMDPDAIVDAHQEEPNYTGGLMQYGGPIVVQRDRRQPQRHHDHDPDPGAEAGGGLAQGRRRCRSSCSPGRSGDPAA